MNDGDGGMVVVGLIGREPECFQNKTDDDKYVRTATAASS
jgi:hypothetical protein